MGYIFNCFNFTNITVIKAGQIARDIAFSFPKTYYPFAVDFLLVSLPHLINEASAVAENKKNIILRQAEINPVVELFPGKVTDEKYKKI